MRRNSNTNDDDRPSLFGDDFALDAPTAKRQGPQPVSMLSGLASRKPKRVPAGRHRWWVGAALLVVSGLALGTYLQTLSFAIPNPFKPAAVTARAATSPPVALPAPVVASRPTPSVPLAAKLETLPAAAPVVSVAVPVPAVPLDGAKERMPAPAAPPHSGPSVAIKADPAAPAGNATQTQRAAPTAITDKATEGRRASGSAPAAPDADVDLLAALMSHPSLAPPASNANVQRVAAVPAAATTAQAVPTGAPRAATVSTGARPRADLSIATLVRDCNGRASKQEALACRRRICEGYWGKAQACPREQQGPPGQSSAPVAPATGRDKT